MTEAASPRIIEFQVNGEILRRHAGTSLADLVTDLGFEPRQVAVERNCEVVPRARLGGTGIETGDRIEIVSFVGGG